MTQKMRDIKACATVKSEPVQNIDKEIFFSSCIGNYFDFSAMAMLNVHRHFEAGVMPYAGGLMDQPAKLIEVMGVISSHRAAREAAAYEKQKREAARGARGR
jgi:hypothetical protein